MLKRLSHLFLPLVVLAFLAGFGRFLFLRFSSGDVYPPYSSFRTDPVGTKALYESLGRLEGVKVTHHVEELRKAAADRESTLLFLGLKPRTLFEGTGELSEIARSGGRVVLAFDARRSIPSEARQNPVRSGRTFKGTNAIPVVATESSEDKLAGLELHTIDSTEPEGRLLEARCVLDPAIDLPWSLPWYGHYWINGSSNNWETVYAIKDKPVVLRQKIGLGSIILVADSFPFSNEGLATKRSTEFLVWTIGPAKRVLFDETHLGVQSGSSIAVLMREYKMHGLVAGLLVLAGLWIWKNSSSFVPAYSDEQNLFEDDSVAGKTTREGILHLLQRNISVQDLPSVCVNEWARANANADSTKRARLKDVEPILASYQSLSPKDRNPIETYQIISEILSPKKS